jgi:hypothetical protein
MAGACIKKKTAIQSRWGGELLVHSGSRGRDGGFFTNTQEDAAITRLKPTQHLFITALIITVGPRQQP